MEPVLSILNLVGLRDDQPSPTPLSQDTLNGRDEEVTLKCGDAFLRSLTNQKSAVFIPKYVYASSGSNHNYAV